MGTLLYGGIEVEFEDRTLAHIQIVIVQKFRTGDSLLMSWLDAASVGDGRSSIWLNPNVPIYFKFFGSRVPVINREWLKALTGSANSSSGLIITTENGELAHAGGLHLHR